LNGRFETMCEETYRINTESLIMIQIMGHQATSKERSAHKDGIHEIILKITRNERIGWIKKEELIGTVKYETAN